MRRGPAAPIDQSRITGFGSDGSKSKTWHCPSGHMLQPWKAEPGACDGCKCRVLAGETVMDCRQCNWYLCHTCHPQEAEQQDWFWGSVTYLMDAAQQEMNEIAAEFKEMANDVESFVSDMAKQASCTVTDKNQYGADENLEFNDHVMQRQTDEKEPVGKLGVQDDEEDTEVRLVMKAEAEDEERTKPGQNAKATGSQEESNTLPPAKEEAQAVANKKAFEEDLINLGQHDLLDLDTPAVPAVVKVPATEPVPSTPAAATVAAPEAAPLGDLLGLGNGAELPGQPLETGIEVQDAPLLDLSSPAPVPAPAAPIRLAPPPPPKTGVAGATPVSIF